MGCGKMGRALLEGITGKGILPSQEIAVIEPNASLRASIATSHPAVKLVEEPLSAKVCIVATKPSEVASVLTSLRQVELDLLISIAAGVTLASMEAILGSDTPVVRAMPNTPGQIGMGISAIAGGSAAGPAEMDRAEELLATLGEVVRISESQLDAVTAISGSGPAYVYYFAEAMIDAGVEMGLSAEMAAKLAVATIAGSAELLRRRSADTRTLRLEVSSPGGTTIAATNKFQELGVSGGIIAGIRACYEKSRALGS